MRCILRARRDCRADPSLPNRSLRRYTRGQISLRFPSIRHIALAISAGFARSHASRTRSPCLRRRCSGFFMSSEEDVSRQEIRANSRNFSGQSAIISTPQEASVVTTLHRRTPLLRREEVAYLAYISTNCYSASAADYVHPSTATLLGIARALQLSVVDTQYMFDLVCLAISRTERFDEPIPSVFDTYVPSIKGAVAFLVYEFSHRFAVTRSRCDTSVCEVCRPSLSQSARSRCLRREHRSLPGRVLRNAIASGRRHVSPSLLITSPNRVLLTGLRTAQRGCGIREVLERFRCGGGDHRRSSVLTTSSEHRNATLFPIYLYPHRLYYLFFRFRLPHTMKPPKNLTARENRHALEPVIWLTAFLQRLCAQPRLHRWALRQ